MDRYDHKSIERKWQDEWAKSELYKTADKKDGKDNFYLLVEFPYPSGNLHVGHWYAFAVPDILARAMRMQGKNVLYPIGFDAFGLPAENAAIKNKLNPRTWTLSNIEYMKKQIASMGTSFDWSREVITCDPNYYKWTQWLFLQLFKRGLVYRKETAVNWCPKDKTVLANEQVINGLCERCDSEVIQKQMLQWNIKITDYADRLIEDLDKLNWPKEIKESQKNWIGRSEGAEIDFPLVEHDIKRFVILHGKGGSPAANSLPWLKKELEKRGYEVDVPKLPNPDVPMDEEQAEHVIKHCTLDEKTAVIGHSFGGVVALRLLEKGIKLGRVTLVATPFSGKFLDKKERPTVTAACLKGFDFGIIRKNCKRFVALFDTSDHAVPISDGESFAKNLRCLLIKAKGQESHFSGAQEPEVLMSSAPSIRVFSTRPDTIFGATYLVLAPEHPWVQLAIDDGHDILSNKTEVRAYVSQAEKKTELERLSDQKEKTGVELKGVKALNPATGEEIPVWVADFVLGHYGTGAVFADAHDERDSAFAKKFGIPLKETIEPLVVRKGGSDAFRENEPITERKAVIAIVKHWSEDKYLCLDYKPRELKYFVCGGIEKGEDAIATGVREIAEETGYTKARFIRTLGSTIHSHFFHPEKNRNMNTHFQAILYQLEDGTHEEVSEREKALHDVLWIDANKVSNFINSGDVDIAWNRAMGNEGYFGKGILFDSGEFSGLTSDEAIPKMTDRYGRRVVKYKLRDWIVSRQRYWGVPIPMIHCEKCGSIPVPDSDLPVVLPEVDDYLPEGSGKSPLAKARHWVEVKCPQCGEMAERETDTLDTFVDSSWYFLRYTDPKNAKEFASKTKMGEWMPIDLYSGGAEHTTMHLLYSRFWHKALFDIGLVHDSEPYTRRMNRSLILGPDGQKMSKSRGNVIDPDQVVERLGADTVRMYLAFVGPYNEVSSYPWNPDGVVGVRRFLERVCRLSGMVGDKEIPALNSPLHKTIKKVGDDIAAMKFNTAVSALMILLNSVEKVGTIGKEQWGTFLKLLAPFAPHLAEHLWHENKNDSSIHLESWPTFDDAHFIDEMQTIVIQINGKVRSGVQIPTGASKETMENMARNAVASRLEGKKILRTIVVPGRLINFVVEE